MTKTSCFFFFQVWSHMVLFTAGAWPKRVCPKTPWNSSCFWMCITLKGCFSFLHVKQSQMLFSNDNMVCKLKTMIFLSFRMHFDTSKNTYMLLARKVVPANSKNNTFCPFLKFKNLSSNGKTLSCKIVKGNFSIKTCVFICEFCGCCPNGLSGEQIVLGVGGRRKKRY